MVKSDITVKQIETGILIIIFLALLSFAIFGPSIAELGLCALIYAELMIFLALLKKEQRGSYLLNVFGISYVLQKFNTPSEDTHPASSFIYWVGASYIFIFGLSAQIYEYTAGRITNQASAVITQFWVSSSIDVQRKPLEFAPYIQQMRCPSQPRLFYPSSIYNSLFKKWTYYQPTVDLLNLNIKMWAMKRTESEPINLSGLVASTGKLSEKSPKNTRDYSRLNLSHLLLMDSFFKDVDLSGSNLMKTNFTNADLRNVNLQNARLTGTIFSFCDLSGADFGEMPSSKLTQPENYNESNDVLDAKFENANIYNIKASQKIKDFAMSQKAQNLPPDQWRKFKQERSDSSKQPAPNPNLPHPP